jgi:spore maturation protein SpmA
MNLPKIGTPIGLQHMRKLTSLNGQFTVQTNSVIDIIINIVIIDNYDS